MMLHAASGSTEMWQHNAEGFAAAGYRAIAFDRRGWGRTRINRETGPQPGTAAALETITVPTLLLAGEADVTQPPWVIRL